MADCHPDLPDYTTPGRHEGEWRNPETPWGTWLAGIVDAGWAEGTEEERDIFASWDWGVTGAVS